jgi:hypothetical protein
VVNNRIRGSNNRIRGYFLLQTIELEGVFGGSNNRIRGSKDRMKKQFYLFGLFFG